MDEIDKTHTKKTEKNENAVRLKQNKKGKHNRI